MAVSGTIQALIAAFSFGILFNAASGALVLYIKGHGSAIYRDGLRLVLILFLLTSSSWALVEFLATLIDPSATSTCQVAVVFSSLFDQLGRVFVEQYLAWAVRKEDAKSPFSLLPQILVFGRFFVGIAFTAVTRTQFNPTCAPISSIRAVSITTIGLDAVIIGLLAIQAFSGRAAGKESEPHSITLKIKTARMIVVGVALWWGTSVASMLGLESLDLFYKTALPGIGLTILVALVTILSQTHTDTRRPPRRPDSPVSQGARDLSSSDSTDYPPSRYEDLKEAGRSIRRNDDGTFPAISRPMTAGSDMNGKPTQEQLFSATNSSNLAPTLSVVPPLPENWGIIKSTGGRTRVIPKPKTKADKLTISHPIINEDEGVQNSFKRIPTIGLEEAASNDKLRREKYARRISALVAQRPAPRPPSPQASPETSTTEPQAAEGLERSESMKTNNTSSGLSVEANASSTATQLSPGADAVRRRSPRQPEPSTLTTPFRVIKPGEPIRIPIPRPPERDQNPPPIKPEPVKTPLQRRPTNGLPSNPRAQTLKSSNETSNRKTQTVMFVNNIVYSNPNAVGDIIQEATKIPQPPNSGDTVVNRPRPIPRKGDGDRQVFPAEISPNQQHRRSKSAGSLMSRKSILQSVSGSPTGLPSLPPIPPMPSMTTRTLPNSTKSMTVEEKMNLLYLTQSMSPSSTELGLKRRSSVPNLPPIPAVPQEEALQPPVDPLSDAESNHDRGMFRISKRSTARTSSILGINMDSRIASQSNGFAASFENRDPVSELGNPWLPGIPDERHAVPEDVKRRSSPVIPLGRQPSTSTFQDEETITNWGSVYSPVAPVTRQNARSTYIRKGSQNAISSKEFPIMLLDESFEDLGDNEPLPSSSDVPQHLSGNFYRRPGDDCPTFSARGDKVRPRKMPPPTPLILNGKTTKREIIIQVAEPSPIDSPRVAYEVIQAQLRNFEKPDRDSTEGSGKRLALLANLEQEMGQLESKWQSTHDHLGRDSMSSVQTSPSRVSRPTSMAPTVSRPSSQRSSITFTIAERRASRRSRMQRGGGEEMLDTSSRNLSQSSENTRSASSQRLTEAHIQYVEQAPELLAKRNDLNVLSTLKASSGNPSLHETDDSYLDGELVNATRSTSAIHALWSQKESKQERSKSQLWEPQTKMSPKQNQLCELPGVYIRSATRKHPSPLAIESSRLWQNGSTLTAMKSHEGLWNNQPSRGPELAKTQVRPVTMRPPRKNRRVTLLPDIIENPEPLPDKRGTLGIFQFPWGEKSENASFQYRPSKVFMAMPGTMTTGNSVGNAMVSTEASEFEADEYSSSFFDDYDEDGDNFSDFSSSGDDEFDETTLWEIASLLQTDQIPSKNSIFPISLQPSPSMDASALEEYIRDMPSDDEHEIEDAAEVTAPLKRMVTIEEQNISGDIVRPLLWTPQHTSQDHQKFGLPQHESWSWKWDERITVPHNRTRSQPLANDFVPIQSTKLWSPVAKEAGSPNESFLWAASKNVNESRATSHSIPPVQTHQQVPRLWVKSGAITNSATQRVPSVFTLPEPDARAWQELISVTSVMKRSKSRPNRLLPSTNSSVLWSRSEKTNPIALWTRPILSENKGLFRPGALKATYRTTTQPPAALSRSKRPFRHNNTPLEPITSTNLWSLKISTLVKPSTANLWNANTSSPEVTIKPVLALATNGSSVGLWNRPVQAQALAPLGLFDPEVSRNDFRRTSKLPAAISTSTTPRLVRENALALTSRNLWAAQHVQTTVAKDEKASFLWQGKLSTSARNTPTLFEVDAGRVNYRTTSADPAALVIFRKPRTIQQPLQALESSQLWANSQATRSEVNWITVHTSYLTKPSPSSLSVSADTALAKTSAAPLPATTTSGQSKGGFFSSLFGKKMSKDPVTTTTPEDKLYAKTSNYDLPELSEGIIIKNLDEIPHAKPVHTALRHRHRRTVVYNANWDAALAEAIAASYPSTVLTLRASYPQDWDTQLSEAVIASYVAPKITRQRTTPRDWSAALHQAVFESYPEFRHLDASVTASASPDISSLWAKTPKSQTTTVDGLWTFDNETDSNLNASQRIPSNNLASYYPMRGNKMAHSPVSETEISFKKQGLWN